MMPKMKSKKAMTKRFKKTGTGKVKYKRAFKSHIMNKKSPKRVRQLRKKGLVHKTDLKKILIGLQN
jgi:large subunit ribosomal protein L35